MIITLIFVFLIILGDVLVNTYIFETDDLALSLMTVGVIGTFVSLIFILGAHVGTKTQIEQNKIVYESLLERQQIIVSEYEDYSKSDVIRDITEWNKEVVNYKYWAYNPWTSWYMNKKVADNLETIELK